MYKKILKDILDHDKYWNYETCINYGLIDGVYNPVTQKEEII